jgi:hypothetical protein
MSDIPEAARPIPQPNSAESAGLLFFGGLMVVIGVVVIIIGVASTGGGYLGGPDLGDLATRNAMVTIGTTAAGAGFIAIVGGLVIKGITRAITEAAVFQRG